MREGFNGVRMTSILPDPSHAGYSLWGGRKDGVVVVMLLLLINNLQLQEELLLLEELRVGRVHLRRALFVGLLVRRDVLVVFELLHLQSRRPCRREKSNATCRHSSFAYDSVEEYLFLF